MDRKNILTEANLSEAAWMIESCYRHRNNDIESCRSNTIDARPASSGEKLDMTLPKEEDIIEIYGAYNTDRYGSDAHGVYGKLEDGRYFAVSFSADYTFSDSAIFFAETLFDIETFGLSDWEREQYGIDLNDHLHC